MSLTPDDTTESGAEDDSDPEIPAGVLRGIEDIDAEETATKADLEAILHS